MMLDDAMPALSGKGKASINAERVPWATTSGVVEEIWNELMECGMKMFRRLLDKAGAHI